MATFALLHTWIAALVVAVVHMPAQHDPHRLHIVATTGMIGDMARRIVGEYADVTTLMGEGVDPHLYKVTVSDVRALAAADVIIANGLMLEGRMGDVFAKLRRRGRLVIEAGAALNDSQRLDSEESHGHPDPHIWMDPSIWSQCALHVAAQLAERDAAHAAVYLTNAEALVTEWQAADTAIARAIASVDPTRRVLVTAHDAFAYFGRHYSVDVMAIQGISTESESGLADIRRLIDVLVARHVPAVFVETSVSDKNVLALVEGARARNHALIIGGSLYSDAMGEAGTPQGTYTGMVKKNAHTIVHALGGDASSLAPQASLASPTPSHDPSEKTK